MAQGLSGEPELDQATSDRSVLVEGRRRLPVDTWSDVVVCGGGPAGVAAAVAAVRSGARTALIELHGALGGVWTSGALSWIIDAALKPGIMAEVVQRLEDAGGHGGHGTADFAYDVEVMKLVLDQLCREAGVRVLLHARVVAAHLDGGGRLRHVVTESKSGRQAWSANAFVDTTGDGDLAALSGCAYESGHPETGEVQPMSLMAIVTGVRLADMLDCVIASDMVRPGEEDLAPMKRRQRSKASLLAEIRRAGVEPSYTGPSLFKIHDDVFAFMGNHQYGIRPDDGESISVATAAARTEIHRIVNGLRSLGGRWAGLRVAATAAQIGVREGRRIAGQYRVTRDDVLAGARHDDAVARVTFGFDVHALTRLDTGYVSNTMRDLHGRSQPYDIPYRALVARDVRGLLMAGRCLSGDFWAHSSYRVTGNAVATGEAAGVAAAVAATTGRDPGELDWPEIAEPLDKLRQSFP